MDTPCEEANPISPASSVSATPGRKSAYPLPKNLLGATQYGRLFGSALPSPETPAGHSSMGENERGSVVDIKSGRPLEATVWDQDKC